MRANAKANQRKDVLWSVLLSGACMLAIQYLSGVEVAPCFALGRLLTLMFFELFSLKVVRSQQVGGNDLS